MLKSPSTIMKPSHSQSTNTKSSSLGILQSYESSEDDDGENDAEGVRKQELLEPNIKRQRLDEGPELTSSNRQLFAVSSERQDDYNRKLPVPIGVLEMFGSNQSEYKEDPAIYKGRKRSFPHIRGNWASFIYLPCCALRSDMDHPIPRLEALIKDTSDHFKDIHTIHPIEEEKHITLSRTLSFRHHWIEPFSSHLKAAMNKFKRVQLVLDEFNIYTNDEKTRTFISLDVNTTESLLLLVQSCDECLAEYELPAYYEDPSFHISFGWMLGDTTDWGKKTLLPYLNKKWKQMLSSDVDLQVISVDGAEFKTGNKVYQFPFKIS